MRYKVSLSCQPYHEGNTSDASSAVVNMLVSLIQGMCLRCRIILPLGGRKQQQCLHLRQWMQPVVLQLEQSLLSTHEF
jgi:hypothetical protein